MIIPLGYAHVVHKFTGQQAPFGAAVTYGVELPVAADGQEVAADLDAAFGTNFLKQMNAGITLDSTTVKFGPNSTGPQYVVSNPRPGLNSGEGEAPSVSVLVRKTTSVGGRTGRGRMYLPGVMDSQVNTNGTLPFATVSALQANADDFYAALVALELPMVLLHSAVSSPTPVNSLEVDGRAATQRRRLRR